MKNKGLIITVLILLIILMGIGFGWTMWSPNNTTSNNSTMSSNSQGEVQKTAQKATNTQTQVTNTPQTDSQAQSEYVTLTCKVCGKQFQTPREGPQLSICDDCVNTPEAEKLLQEAGYV